MATSAPSSQSGFQIVEMLVALAVFGLGVTLSVPPLLRVSAGLRVELGAREISSVLREARSLAITRSVNVAVRFTVAADGQVSFALYRDGDGDGVLSRDIDAGIDLPLTPVRWLENVGREVRIGLPPVAVKDPGDPGQWLAAGGDAVRFNASDMASFSSLGESTPGSIYVTDGGTHLAVVRVFGRTGKIKVLTYDFATTVWEGP